MEEKKMEKDQMEMKRHADIFLVYKCTCLVGVIKIGKCILYSVYDIWL